MNNTLIEKQDQTINPDKLGIFGDYFSRLKVGRMLNKSGITKTKGASPLGRKGSRLLLTLINIDLLFTCMVLVFQLYF